MSARIDLALLNVSRRLFPGCSREWLAAQPGLVAILEPLVACRAAAQKAAVRQWEYCVRGKFSGLRLVFYGNGPRQYVRNYVIPRDPRTRRQARVRARMGAVSSAWAARLSPEQRAAWNAAAAQELTRRLPQGRLTGQTLFVRHNSVLELAGRPWALWPPARVDFGPNPVQALRVGWDNEQARLELRVAGPVEHDVLLFGDRPAPAGRTRPRHPVYLGVVPAGTVAGAFDLTDWYVGRFGAPAPGQRVFICAQQQRGGWRDQAQALSAVVPAQPAVAGEVRTPKSEVRRNPEGQLAREAPNPPFQPLFACTWETLRPLSLHSWSGPASFLPSSKSPAARTDACRGRAPRPCRISAFRQSLGWRKDAQCGAALGRRERRRLWRELWRGT